jgi:hypothetical protein
MAALPFLLPALVGGTWPVPDARPAQLRSRVYQQFKASNWAIPLANAIGSGLGQIEGATIALLAVLSIETITDEAGSPWYGVGRGIQLDRIGSIIGIARGSVSDAEYRPILRAKVAADRAKGGPVDVIKVFDLLSGTTGTQIIAGWEAAFAARLAGPLDPLLVQAAQSLLRACTQAGAYSVLEYTTSSAPASYDVAGQGWTDVSQPATGAPMGGAVSI